MRELVKQHGEKWNVDEILKTVDGIPVSTTAISISTLKGVHKTTYGMELFRIWVTCGIDIE